MTTHRFCRTTSLDRLKNREKPWDMVVIGGGATGVGVALDAASRGLDVALLEQADFGQGTSTRSTKLIHGGVRYLRQGNFTLVRDALRERALLRENAPHLVHDLAFLIPCRRWWQRWFYRIGLKLYDFLAVKDSFGRSLGVSRTEALRLVANLKSEMVAGGVVYHDGQFDDARLLINMARTAADHDACLLNYCEVTELTKDGSGTIVGLAAIDGESGESLQIPARCVVNAAGPFCDAVRSLDDPSQPPMIAPSQGIHLVLPRHFYDSATATIVPKTSDGRVIFIIPWHGAAIVGTTDTPIEHPILEPTAQRQEIEFLLETASQFLAHSPSLKDVLGVFVGIRPLVRGDKSARTASLSRDHTIVVSDSRLITITGGKWTTVRKMAEDAVNRAMATAGMEHRRCRTKTLKIHGADGATRPGGQRSHYGSDLAEIVRLEEQNAELAEWLDQELAIKKSDILWAVRHEMARTIEDVLARRTRALFLNPSTALRIAPAVGELMARHLGNDAGWIEHQLESFRSVASHYLPPEHSS